MLIQCCVEKQYLTEKWLLWLQMHHISHNNAPLKHSRQHLCEMLLHKQELELHIEQPHCPQSDTVFSWKSGFVHFRSLIYTSGCEEIITTVETFLSWPTVGKTLVFCNRISAYIPTLSLPLLLQLQPADKDKPCPRFCKSSSRYRANFSTRWICTLSNRKSTGRQLMQKIWNCFE